MSSSNSDEESSAKPDNPSNVPSRLGKSEIPPSVCLVENNNVEAAVAFYLHHLERGTWKGEWGNVLLRSQDDSTELRARFAEIARSRGLT